MKDRAIKRIVSLLAAVLLLTAVFPTAALAEGSSLYVTGYTVTDAYGYPLGSVTKGTTVNITVSLKDVGADPGDPGTLDIVKLDDSFTGGWQSVVQTSAPGMPLTYDVQLTNLQYKGVGQSLKLQIGTAGKPESYQSVELTITEAVVYEAPQVQPPPAPEPAPAPVVLISQRELPAPLAAGQETEIQVSFYNMSNIALTTPVAVFTPSDGLMISGGSSSLPLNDIGGGQETMVRLRVSATKNASAANQSIGVELKFNYFNNVALTQGTATERLTIPVQPRESVPQPVVMVSRSPMSKPLSANETADITISFQNTSTTQLVSPVVSVAASDSLTILNDTSTFLLKDIGPGGSQSVTVKVRAAKEIASSSQFLSTELKYSYDNGEALTQATASDRVNISANPTSTSTGAARTDAPVPNVVVRKFTYGDSSVAAGSKFTLGVTFENTGTLKIENVVALVDGGESFTMDGGTNTFYYKSLAAGGNQSMELPMRAVSNGKSGAQSVSLGFKYEYVDGGKRSQASADIKLSIPVYQPDRFQINAPVVPETATVGEEAEISLAYVNKGKDDIANVEATVEGDGVETPARTQYLGNITAGSSGNIGFALAPTSAGEVEVTLKISYENADQQIQTRLFPITLRAEEPVPVDDFMDEGIEEDSQQAIPWPWLAGGGAAVILVAGVGTAILLKRRKNAALAAQDSWDDWDEPVDTGDVRETGGREP